MKTKNIFLHVSMVGALLVGQVFFFFVYVPTVESAVIVRGVYSPRRLVTIPCLCSASVLTVAGPTRPAVVNVHLTLPYPLRSWYQMYTGAKVAGVYFIGGVCLILTPIGCIPIKTMGTAFLDGSAIP